MRKVMGVGAFRMRLAPLAVVLVAALAAMAGLTAWADQPYAPNREYDLQHVKADLRFVPQERGVIGEVTHTLAPIRDGSTQLEFDSAELTVQEVRLNGKKAKFETAGHKLIVKSGATLARGQSVEVTIRYEGHPRQGLFFILPDSAYPNRPIQVWTQGESEDTQYYLPIYDYPNDRTTSEIILTVPANWWTLSNGKLASTTEAGSGMKRWHWKQEKPHSTYLITVVAGEFDRAEDTWHGIPVRYAVPRGMRDTIEPTYGNTKAMLDYFTQILGVDYPWAQYAQVAVEEFTAGGMENTSATTISASELVDPRLTKESLMNQDDLVSHELAHQWFGDMVTCKDWGQVWLNEGFASYFEVVWQEHRYGKENADYTMWQTRNQWMRGRRLYDVPLVTHDFTDFVQVAGNVYGKGSWVLYMLRQELGDKDFYAALKHYLEKNQYQNVVTADLVGAIEEATGKNTEEFFDQWVHGAGAPKLEVGYTWDESSKQVKLLVKQTQKVEGRVGLFRFPVEVEIASGGKRRNYWIAVSKAEETFALGAKGKPEMVAFDPGGLVLSAVEFKKDAAEWSYQLKHADRVTARLDAASELGKLKDANGVVAALGQAAASDPYWGVRREAIQALRQIGNAEAAKQLLAAFSKQEPWVRVTAAAALGSFVGNSEVAAAAERIYAEDPAYRVRAAALGALALLEPKEAYPKLLAATRVDSPEDRIRIAALRGLGVIGNSEAVPVLLEWSRPGVPIGVRTAAISSLGRVGKDNSKVTETLAGYMSESSRAIVISSSFALAGLDDGAALGAFEAAEKRRDLTDGVQRLVSSQAERLRRSAAAKKNKEKAAGSTE